MNWLATGGHAVLSLCSGYGGLELALQRVLPTSYVGAYCENYGPAQQVLQAHNPRVDVFKDVRDPKLLNLKAPIVTFGFPCQDLSVAGNRAGLDGERSGLFHTCMAVVRATYPDLVVVENVPRLLRYRDVVNAQFHEAGFETAWVTRRACDAGLPHKRERVFVVAKRPGVHFLGYCEPVEPTWPTPTGYITGLGLSTAAQRRLLGNGVAPAGRARNLGRTERTGLRDGSTPGRTPGSFRINWPTTPAGATRAPPPARPGERESGPSSP